MNLPGVALLLADTMRSRAYAQALVHAGARVDAAIIVRSPDKQRWGQAHAVLSGDADLGAVFVPDLSVPLGDSVAEVAANVTESDAGTINAEPVVRWIDETAPALVVFSGFGGEILRDQVLGAGAPLLHLHSGWVPDYRGSTTLYYSYLQEGWCGVTAMLMEADIDTGPIVARRRYPPPPPGIDVDYVYDSAIRADLLLGVLRDWAAHGGAFPELVDQPVEGTTYFIIHPVLKHLALDGMQRGAVPPPRSRTRDT